MEPSVEEALAYLKGRRFDGYLFADLVRYHTCCRLEETALPKGVAFERLPNNGMLLRCDGARARVWKADEDGELQGPGVSKSKQAYFDQEQLFWDDPRFYRFAITWQYDFDTGLLGLSLACPKQYDEERPWRNPKCHFYIPFPDAALTITAGKQFEEAGDDGDINLRPKRAVQESNESADD
jgi:hypothetical protein